MLALKISDVDFERDSVIILHLNTRAKISWPRCKVRLAKRHQLYPACGEEINEITKRQQERRRIRTLPVDDCTWRMLKEYVNSQLSNKSLLNQLPF